MRDGVEEGRAVAGGACPWGARGRVARTLGYPQGRGGGTVSGAGLRIGTAPPRGGGFGRESAGGGAVSGGGVAGRA